MARCILSYKCKYVLFYVDAELTIPRAQITNNWLLSRFSELIKFENTCESSAVRRFTKKYYFVKITKISNMSFAASYRCVFFSEVNLIGDGFVGINVLFS